MNIRNEFKINELIQYRMRLKEEVRELVMAAEAKKLEIRYISSQIDLLSINQLEIDFDESK
jgi:hypothetical protein